MAVDPNGVHTREELRRGLHGLHLEQNSSYQKLSEKSGVAPNTIHDWVHGKTFPRWQNLVPVLAVWGVVDPKLIRAWKDAHGRAFADTPIRLGVSLTRVNPFNLEVHEPITVDRADDLPPLPPYVARAHDRIVREVVAKAAAGRSGIVVLLGESSTGKTRALWEALEPLTERGGWQIWHPRLPTRRSELTANLAKVGPRTVLWLNETQRYFAEASPEEQENTANALKALLEDPRRAPILILGSLWRAHYAALCADPTSATRRLFDDAIVEIPTAFAGEDLEAMQCAAELDIRIAQACARAESGEITQYIAGGPELIDRYERQVSPEARAVIEVAMDALRLGHSNILPFKFLRDAAPAYLTDSRWSELEDDWFELALAETSRSCKGTRGPLTYARERRKTSRSKRHSRIGSEEPLYQLADYLDQYSRNHRLFLIPPIGFWEAVAAHVDPEYQYILAHAAWEMGLYRDAAQLWKNAARSGLANAAYHLIAKLGTVFPGEHRAAEWIIREYVCSSVRDASSLFSLLQEIGAIEQLFILTERVARTSILQDWDETVRLLNWLRDVGAGAHAELLAERAAIAFSSDIPTGVDGRVEATTIDSNAAPDLLTTSLPNSVDPGELAILLDRHISATSPGRIRVSIGHRLAAQISLDSAIGVAYLLDRLHAVGAHAEFRTIADKVAAQFSLDHAAGVTWLFGILGVLGAREQARTLAERCAIDFAFDKPAEVAELFGCLQEIGAHEQIRMLVDRDPASRIGIGNVGGVALLMRSLQAVGAHRQVRTLAARCATDVHVGDVGGIIRLLKQMRSVGAHEQVELLARRAAVRCALDNLGAVIRLMGRMRSVGAYKQGQLLADRAAAHFPLENTHELAELLIWLRKFGAHDQIQILADRVSRMPLLDDLNGVPRLCNTLSDVGAYECAAILFQRLSLQNSGDEKAGLNELPFRPRTVAAADKLKQPDAPVEWFASNSLAEVPDLLFRLRESGAHEQLRAVARHAVEKVSLADSVELARLITGLRAVAIVDCLTALADRIAAHFLCESPAEVRELLHRLHTVGAYVQADQLAERAAAEVPLDNPSDVSWLLNELREIGAKRQMKELAERAAREVPLDNAAEVAWLLSRLRELGSTMQEEALAERLPKAGMFEIYIDSSKLRKERMRFGWDPDCSGPAEAWSWSDLT